MEYVRRTTRSFFTRRSNSEKKEKKVPNFIFLVSQSSRIPSYRLFKSRATRAEADFTTTTRKTNNKYPLSKSGLPPRSHIENVKLPHLSDPKMHFAANNLGKSRFSPPAAHPRLAIRRLRLWQETDLISGRIRR